jgi:hypothetical protein
VSASTLDSIKAELGRDWLPELYAKIKQGRTRAVTIDVPARENAAAIQHTLLGIELKIGRKRFPCPDLATARYMRVFARIGVTHFAIPYDITRISPAADELETLWQRMLLVLDNAVSGHPSRGRSLIRSRLIRDVRDQVSALGPGDHMPAFNSSTASRSKL